MRNTLLAAFSLLISHPLGSALAAQPAGDVAGRFGDVVDVRVVNLEVDGRPMPIEYFTEVRDGAATTTAGGAELEAVPGVDSGAAVSTHYLVFIDEYFAVARDRDRAVDDLISQLPSLGAADRMAILAWSGGELELLSDWNRSASDLTRVLEAARDRPTAGLQRDLELRPATRDPRTGRVPYGDPYTDPENRYHVNRLKERLERLMQAAATAMRSFARPTGRKAMLLFAGGWPYNPWDVVAPGSSGPRRFSAALDYGPWLYRQLYDAANRLGYTLYPVDVRSFGAGARTTAVLRSLEDAQYRSDLAIEREWSEHSTLTHLADETGGRAFLGSNDSPSAPAPERIGRCDAQLKLRRQRHVVVVSIHDPLSGRILWTRLELDPRADSG